MELQAQCFTNMTNCGLPLKRKNVSTFNYECNNEQNVNYLCIGLLCVTYNYGEVKIHKLENR